MELILERVQKLRDLPVLSVVRAQGLDLLTQKKATRRDFAEALKYDQVLSAKILRLVNSSAYGLQKNISQIEKALNFLGDNTLQILFLGSNVFEQKDQQAPFRIKDFWLHNYMVAVASSQLASMTKKMDPSEAFSCGLLHDLGKLALWKTAPEEFKKIRAVQEIERVSFFQAESKLQLPGHHVLGEEVARAWSLPYTLRKTLRFHHRNVLEMQSLDEKSRVATAHVILANQLVKRMSLGNAWGLEEESLFEQMQNFLGLSTHEFIRIESILSTEAANATRYLFKV